jgi:hypothetical protein
MLSEKGKPKTKQVTIDNYRTHVLCPNEREFIYIGYVDATYGLPHGKGNLYFKDSHRIHCESDFIEGLACSWNVQYFFLLMIGPRVL